MSANINELQRILKEMKDTYVSNPTKSVRNQHFIKNIHEYCISELKNVGIVEGKVKIHPDSKTSYYFEVITEASIFGSHKPKNVDVAVIEKNNGPQIIIGVRSQMSSVGKNLLTYYEEIIGDCISLHDRFPMAVIGYVYLLPARPIKEGLEKERVDVDRAERLFARITGRNDWHDTGDKYEHFALLKVDFASSPPRLLDSRDPLKIDDFFDKIVATYNERKPL
jgi:hypothetical protein